MTRIKANLIRNPNSVLVGVRTPNAVLPVPAIERHYSDWTEIATEIASDAVESAPDTLTPEPHETTPSIASVDEIRVYRVRDGKLKRIYTGNQYTDDIPQRCQTHADLSGCVVWLMSATDSIPFDPASPKTDADTPPISDETDTVLVYNEESGELIWAGSETKGFANRSQTYADQHTVTLKVISNSGLLTRFYVPRKVSRGYSRENAERMQKAVEAVSEIVTR